MSEGAFTSAASTAMIRRPGNQPGKLQYDKCGVPGDNHITLA